MLTTTGIGRSVLSRPKGAALCSFRQERCKSSAPPIISIENGTFYRNYPSTTDENNPPLFPGLNFYLPSGGPVTLSSRCADATQERWAVVGSSGKSTFLQILLGRYICVPPTARSYPYLSEPVGKSTWHGSRAQSIRYVGFTGDSKQGLGGGIHGHSYLSARYESRREASDFSLLQYLQGKTSLNPLETESPAYSEDLLSGVIADLRLEKLLDMPVANLSSGQHRRARIAKAVLDEPEVLLLDEPFMGLDPPSVKSLTPLLYNMAVKNSPRLVLSLKPQDPIPSWITHWAILGPDNSVELQGHRNSLVKQLRIWKAVSEREILKKPANSTSAKIKLALRSPEEEKFYESLTTEGKNEYDRAQRLRKKDKFKAQTSILRDFGAVPKTQETVLARHPTYGEPIVEMNGVQIKYDDKTVLGGWRQDLNREGLFWRVRRGQRWGVFGLNGSGKTTLISLITSDHPQAYAQPMKVFGRSRIAEPGLPAISLFDLQSRIGHSSPEIHRTFPRTLSIRASIESAWAETFVSKPKLDKDRKLDVDAALLFFEADLNPAFVPHTASQRVTSAQSQPEEEEKEEDPDILAWANEINLRKLSLQGQKLILFLRAVIHRPDLIVLDEAFSGMSPTLRDKCLHFLEVGEIRRPSTGSLRTRGFAEAWNLPSSLITKEGTRNTGLSDRQALIVVSHVKEEVPNAVSSWMKLPGAADEAMVDGNTSGGEEPGLRTGVLGERETISDVWDEIWRK